jgi:Xaa-Pro aminopeptidase
MPDYQQRRDQLRRQVRKANADALLVTHPPNVTYLTGFTGDASYLLLSHDKALVLSDPRYTTQLEEECPELECVIRPPGSPILVSVAKAARSAGVGKLAIEAASMAVASYLQLPEQLPGVELLPTTGLVERQRQIKDKEEIGEIVEAIRIAERAFAVVKASLRDECSEKQVADQLDHQIRLFGGECCSFWPIVAVGPRAALPHARPGGTQIGESGALLVDWGARSRGLYLSDLTRVVFTGKVPNRLEKIYQIVLAAQQAAIDGIRPGAIMEDVDAAARQVIAERGYGRRFSHGLGHGIGLEVHEQPRLAVDQKKPLKAGMVLTVEPGIYLPGWGGVRIEDDVLVTRGGHEVLSHCPKELADCHLP